MFPFFSTTMVNSRLTNITSLNATNPLTLKGETQDVHATIFWIIPCIIINGITCPFTFILNVLVIAAVKRRPRLQSNANIMLACLAVTDALIGLIAQPLFVLSISFYPAHKEWCYLKGSWNLLWSSVHLLLSSSYASCFRETRSNQIYLSLSLYCDQAKHQVGSSILLDLL